jgi:hypothetical protein
MIQQKGLFHMRGYWLATDVPEFRYTEVLCPTKLPLVWEFEGKLYLVPFAVIKNARRLRRDRQAHLDVYNVGTRATAPVITLDQAVPLHLHDHYLEKLSTEQKNLEQDKTDANSDTP